MIVQMAASMYGRHGVVEVLNREWSELAADRSTTLGRWAGAHPALGGCETLAEVLSAVRARPDATLAALLTEVAGGDCLAGRVVLQSMLGRMVRMAARDRYAGVDEYVGALWLRICSYPLARRPVRIAANLSMDAFKSVLAERCAQRQPEVGLWPPELFLDDHFQRNQGVLRATTSRAEALDGSRVLALGRSLDVLNDQTHRLLAAIYLDGLNGREAAELLGSSSASVRARCSKAVRRLAERSDELLAAA